MGRPFGRPFFWRKRMARRPQIESSDVGMPEDRSVDIGITKPLDDDLIYIAQEGDLKDPRIAAALKEERDMKAFMEQKVKFMIAETDDESAPNPVSCGVNGVRRDFWRGREYTDKRMFIDSLIKVVRKVKTVNFKNAEGVDDTRMEFRSVLAYPLQIIDDPAGDLGRRWFRHQQENAF